MGKAKQTKKDCDQLVQLQLKFVNRRCKLESQPRFYLAAPEMLPFQPFGKSYQETEENPQPFCQPNKIKLEHFAKGYQPKRWDDGLMSIKSKHQQTHILNISHYSVAKNYINAKLRLLGGMSFSGRMLS